jgi:hypothetical protein
MRFAGRLPGISRTAGAEIAQQNPAMVMILVVSACSPAH